MSGNELPNVPEIHARSPDQYRLRQLHKWLTREVSSSGLVFGAFILPPRFIGLLLVIAAVVFTPYMLRTLYRLERFGWIKGFFIVVGIPFLLCFIPAAGYLNWFLASLPLITFYLYTWALRHTAGEWLEELRWQAH